MARSSPRAGPSSMTKTLRCMPSKKSPRVRSKDRSRGPLALRRPRRGQEPGRPCRITCERDRKLGRIASRARRSSDSARPRAWWTRSPPRLARRIASRSRRAFSGETRRVTRQPSAMRSSLARCDSQPTADDSGRRKAAHWSCPKRCVRPRPPGGSGRAVRTCGLNRCRQEREEKDSEGPTSSAPVHRRPNPPGARITLARICFAHGEITNRPGAKRPLRIDRAHSTPRRGRLRGRGERVAGERERRVRDEPCAAREDGRSLRSIVARGRYAGDAISSREWGTIRRQQASTTRRPSARPGTRVRIHVTIHVTIHVI